MTRSLRTKFLVLLVTVSAVALSAAFVLRQLMILDFRDYLEGEREDRVYWITADLERTYEKQQGWNRDVLDEDALWAMSLGFEIRVLDSDGRVVAGTESALASLSPLMKRRNLAAFQPRPRQHAEFDPYPLFLAGTQIGTLEIAPLERTKDAAFIRRSRTFLVVSLLALGGIALILSAMASRRLTRPLRDLTAAAASIGGGDLAARVTPAGKDEVGALGQTFNRMAQAIESVEKLRKMLLTNLAHELRTPLGAMRAELEGMLDGLIPAGKKELQSLHDETGRLRRMLDGMEDLAHAQGSPLTLRKQPVVLKPLLQEIVGRIERSLGCRDVRMTLECADDIVIDADPDKLSQVVINVLDNAVKAVGERGAVSVTASADRDEVVLAIADDGVGIAPADLPFIFERFYRGAHGGLGLGLAIVKELMEAHGGTIQVESRPGEGSEFTMLFPA